MERTICDLIKGRNKIDSQVVKDAVLRYMGRDDKNLLLLSKYSKSFRVDKIRKE